MILPGWRILLRNNFVQHTLYEVIRIDGIYEHVDEIKGKLKENLINSKEQVKQSYELATICLDVPVEFDEKALTKETPNMEALNKLFEELEFRTMISRIQQIYHGGQPVQGDLFGEVVAAPVQIEVTPTSFKTIKDVPHQYILIDNEMALASVKAES